MDPTRLLRAPYGPRFGRGVRQEPSMKRRTFIALVSGSFLAAPLAAEAQQAGRVWRIGHLDGTSPMARAALLTAFKDRLQEMGYAPSQYVLDSRYAEGDDARLAELAADLIRGKPDVIITAGPQPAFAAARATTTIPIVFIGVGDPVGTGLVPSLARPGGNITGVTLVTVELARKRLDLLGDAVPAADALPFSGTRRTP